MMTQSDDTDMMTQSDDTDIMTQSDDTDMLKNVFAGGWGRSGL